MVGLHAIGDKMRRSLQLTRRQTFAALAGVGLAGLRLDSRSALARDANARSKSDASIDAKTAKWLTLPPTPALPSTSRRGTANVNGTGIFYAQFGQGPPVLLFHGGLGNSNYWGRQVEYLAKNFSVIVMDTRGHGRSPVTSRAFSYGLFAEDAAALMDFLQISQAAIVGWSDGAVTGLRLAMMRPEKVSKLLAFGANISADGLKANGGRSSVFGAYVQRCKAEYAQLSPHPERWSQLLDGLRIMWRSEPNFTKRNLSAAKAPTVVADGEYDEIIKAEHAAAIASAMPRARPLILPGVSHFAMLQDPDQFNRALTAFLTA
jgi:pimeloyl-ACP methyl ester carboxylesterase